MFRVIIANLNGIRSAAKKGFFDWFGNPERAPMSCACRRSRCSQDDLTPEFPAPHGGFQGYFQHAVKKGYSGAGLYTRHEPDEVIIGFGSEEFDPEGRYWKRVSGSCRWCRCSAVRFERRRTPAGEIPLHGRPMPHLAALSAQREVVLCGDVNIVHKEIDIKNWKSNQKNSGCLPEEREWLTKLFDEVGYVDVFRTLDQRPEQYHGGATGGHGLREERRVADRLSDRDARRRVDGEGDVDLPRREVQRPRAADGRLRLEDLAPALLEPPHARIMGNWSTVLPIAFA